MFTAVLFVVGGQALAGANEDAPGQLKKAEQEVEEIESEETESIDTESDEGSEDATAAEEDEGSEDDGTQQEFRSSDSGSSSARKSSDGSSGATTRVSSDDEDDPNFVETAEHCPNEANRFGEFTGNGANDSGAYDSTCDGRDSENGNGNGEASGRPCMGCVGNADNKNPPGQFPDGSDANNGYECDGNNGVGKGNPAHTDCLEEEDRDRVVPPVKRPPLPDVIKRPSVPPDRVLPRPPFARPPEVPKFVPRRRVSVLPVTGPSQLLPFIWLAMSLIAAGIAALLSSRRRKELGARDW